MFCEGRVFHESEPPCNEADPPYIVYGLNQGDLDYDGNGRPFWAHCCVAHTGKAVNTSMNVWVTTLEGEVIWPQPQSFGALQISRLPG